MEVITYRNDMSISGEPIIIAECGTASAIYDCIRDEYSGDADDDQCPATEDGCWPEPPATMVAAAYKEVYGCTGEQAVQS